MAFIKFEAGAELDIATGPEILAMGDGIKKTIEGKRGNPDIRTQATGVVSLGTAIQLKFGRPPSARVWNIVSVTTLGADDHTSLSGASVALYIGDDATAPLGDCVIPAMPVPFFDTITREVLWQYHNQELFAMVNGNDSPGQVIVRVGIVEYRMTDVMLQSGR